MRELIKLVQVNAEHMKAGDPREPFPWLFAVLLIVSPFMVALFDGFFTVFF
jgi:hypothetical protein